MVHIRIGIEQDVSGILFFQSVKDILSEVAFYKDEHGIMCNLVIHKLVELDKFKNAEVQFRIGLSDLTGDRSCKVRILVGVLSRGLIIHAIIVPSNSGNGTAVQELLQNKATGRLCGVLILCPVDKGKIVPRKIACV